MRDRHFREDENELPYLLYEKRDEYKRSGKPVPLRLDFKDIHFREFPSYLRRLNLALDHKNYIIDSVEVEPQDCIFSIRQDDDEVILTFEVRNEYVATRLSFQYDLNGRRFEYLGGTTYHDGLEAMEWFKSVVRKTEKENGFKFIFCYNGHSFDRSNGRLLIRRDFQTMVMFERDRYDDHYGYKVDFATRTLREYHEYPFFEFFEFFG